ncbi:hypothetical protein H5410_003815 [Solanum commersonii]|uniref:Uncharacterized protein n=1 Tax=Solanum commersonii TaxID=4109 RepID=A0A9J6B667_SOLCO|nr:hypothetical protein H5410_003815 [Solanum commersonii]
MDVHQIDFSPGSLARKYVQNEFSSDKWNGLKLGFLTLIVLMSLIKFLKNFMKLFITTYLPLFINVLERSYKDESGNIVKTIYPPQASFILSNNTGITFTAFQKFVEEDVAAVGINEINNLISQNNYLGLYVNVLGEHISSLDKKLDELTALIIQIKTNLKTPEKASTSKQHSKLSTHVQRPPEIQDFFSDFSAKPMDLSENFADEIEQAFDFKRHVVLEFNKLCGYPKNKSGNTTQFAHKPSMQTYYYSRPTPQDVLIEERDWNQTNTSYSGSEIYKWNLDGLTDRQLTILFIKC